MSPTAMFPKKLKIITGIKGNLSSYKNRVIFWLYELIFWVALALVSPYYFLRMKRRGGYARGFLERFGFFESVKRSRLRDLRPIWIHAVSVGEVNLALQLIEKLRLPADTSTTSGAHSKPRMPPLALSTTTSTGHAFAAQKLPPDIPLFYYPVDSRFCFGRVHRLLQPSAFILMEAELWPNHLRFCSQRKIPLALINARLSERRYPRYRRFRWLFEPALRGFRLVTLQSVDDEDRLSNLGFPRESLAVVGNLKYDATLGSDPVRRSRLLADLAVLRDRPLWVAGSTHPGEEAMVIEIFLRLKAGRPRLALALAPRHAERTEEIADLLRRHGISFVRRSDLNSREDPLHPSTIHHPPSTGSVDALLFDTTGELKHLYEQATLIFMGKSLFGHGGQNIIEPAICGKAVLFGPNMENFAIIARDFLEARAAIQVRDAADLEKQASRLLDDAREREELGARAADVVRGKQGALKRTLNEIRKMLSAGK